MARSYLILILVVIIIDAQHISGQYEFFRLVTFWGPSFCRINPCNRRPPLPKFTLHGLWPDNYTWHLYNCRGTRYVPLQDQQSINKRDDYWYDYFLLNPPSTIGNWHTEQSFWVKEWSRHGTCSENVFSQRNYFNLAEKLMLTHNLTNILFNQRTPITFPWPRVSDVMLAISNSIGVRPELRCRYYQNSYYKNSQMLVEVALCYDNRGNQVIDCPRPGFLSCGKRRSIIYVPMKFQVVL